jgi:glycosyltransferase involved in cell wall biosynthesis
MDLVYNGLMKSVSVVMPTYNSLRTIEACLKSIREQDYDQSKIEILAADGGSSDGTIGILDEYGAKVINEQSGSPEKAKAIALKQAKNELVLFLASDNILPHKRWLRQMAAALEKEPAAVAAYPWRYAYRKTDTSLNRYFALLGANDPVAWFMGKADRQAHGSNKWRLAGEAKDKGDYWLVEFDEKNMPTLGDNGFLVRQKQLMKAKTDERHFFHIDVVLDLVRLGFNKLAVVKTEIIHDTGEEYFSFIKKRFRYMGELYLRDQRFRRYVWVKNWQEKIKIFGYIVYSLTLIGPLLEAFNGWRKKRDSAWFWHPLMCFSMVWVYGLALVMKLFSKTVPR